MSKRSKDDRRLIKEQNDKIERMQRIAHPLDEIEYRQYLRVNNDRILFFTTYKNEVNFVVQDPNFKLYQLTEEPDGRTLAAQYRFLKFAGAGDVIKDYSGFRNHGSVAEGSPSRGLGHADYSSSVVFNGSNTTLRIPHRDSVSILGLSEGFTITGWINPTNLDLHGGEPRVIVSKIDDDPTRPERGYSVWLMPNGTLFFAVMFAGVSFARAATAAIIPNSWSLFQCSFQIAGSVVPPLIVNSQTYTNDTQISDGSITPYFAPSESTAGLDMLWGSTLAVGKAHFAGRMSDMRFWRNRLITSTEHSNLFVNKYTISNVQHPALVGVANLAYGAGGGGGGGIPPPAPPPVSVYSFSPVSFSAKSFKVNKNETGTDAPGGGGGTTFPLIPDQFVDTFDTTYTLATLDQVSPDLKWKLTIVPGGTGTGAGFVSVEDYTYPGTAETRLLRMKRGASPGPTVVANQYQFQDVWMRCRVRTVSQLATGDNNYARLMFKYVGQNDHYSVLVRPTGVRLLKTEGSETNQVVLAEQANPSGNILHPLGTNRFITVETRNDGNGIAVYADGQLVINYTTGTPQDTIIQAMTPVALRASGCEATFDDVLVRPVFGDSFQGLTYTLSTVGSKSLNQRWELVTAGAGNAVIRTYDDGVFANGGRVLNINTGSTGDATMPVVLSAVSYKSLSSSLQMATKSQYTTAENNNAYYIFKWKDANNYYAFIYHTTGWKIIRRLAGVEMTVASDTGKSYPLNAFRNIQLAVSDEAKYVLVTISGQKVYEETANTPAVERISDGDGGLLAGVGRIGFTALRCNAVFDNVASRASGIIA